MRRKYTMSYHESPTPITDPVTKFGGQPVWLGEPQWPLSRSYGEPMRFICQIALPADIFPGIEPRIAYLFITDDAEHGYVAATFDPDDGENALILQPGGIYEGRTAALREGPTLYQREWIDGAWRRTPVELAVELAPGNDPEPGYWDNVDDEDPLAWDAYMGALFEDKIGGTPVPTVNRPEFPALSVWRLLVQLNTRGEDEDDLFFLNFADDGVGYGFISEDGRQGRFLWSR